jgi:hypothetical protein
MKNNLYKLLAIALFLFVVPGCTAVNQIRKEIDKSQQPQVLTSTDGKSQITVPGIWKKETELNDLATLQASNAFNELYIVSIPQSKADFTEEITLETITDFARDEVKSWVNDAQMSEAVPVLINGYSGRQFEVGGAVQGVKAKYIYTVLDAPENYYQILAWTLASRYEGNKGKLLEVVNSFKENNSANIEGPPAPPAPVESVKPTRK